MRGALQTCIRTALFGGFLACGAASAGIELVTTPSDPGEAIDLGTGPYVPPSGEQTDSDSSSEEQIAALILACDQEAAHPGNKDNPAGIPGVKYTDMNGFKALPACTKAVDVAPDNKRLRYQLARAKQISGLGRDALDDLTVLAEEDYVPAINNLGATYQLGIGVPKDYEKAVEWYEISASKGFVPSMAVVGWMHHSGLGTPKDDKKAIEWYLKAADGGSASAMYNMGYMYHKGWGVEENAKTAAVWFEKSAAAGFGQAMAMTAWTYQVGHGVPLDGKLAIEWYEKAAEHGELSAMAALGHFYDVGGSGIERQPKKAAEWLLKSLQGRNPQTRTRLIDSPETLQFATRVAFEKLLLDSGFEPGDVDGEFGRKTRTAIESAFLGN